MQARDYQEEAICAPLNYFDNGGRGNPVVAMPTGTGKSFCIAETIRRILFRYSNQRILMLTHVKELIEQNAETMLAVWPTAPLGIYSAGLKQKDVILPIIFGGIASVNKRPQVFGWRDLVFIDECHLLGPSDDTMYKTTLAALKLINPRLKVIGYSATPYRLKLGMITDGGVFTDICFDITTTEAFHRLIAEGWMSPPIAKPTRVEIDVSDVGISSNDDYNQKQLETASDRITFEACREMVEVGFDRQSWLVFASGVVHAEHVASMLQSFGISAVAVHSKLSNEENDERISAFKAGHYRCLVNMNKLTTGFNHPPIDLIGMLRPTLSPGLWVQMLGRGTRPSPATGKKNCLVLDFARNTQRLGTIDAPRVPRKPGEGGGDLPIRICGNCRAYNHAAARFCIACGYEFEFETKIFKTASEAPLLSSDAPVVEYFNVDQVWYKLHEKKNASGILVSPPSIKVSYLCGMKMFHEWVCLEHSGFPGKKAREWWRQRHVEEPPPTTFQALQRTHELREPSRIRVWVNRQNGHPEVLGYEY